MDPVGIGRALEHVPDTPDLPRALCSSHGAGGCEIFKLVNHQVQMIDTGRRERSKGEVEIMESAAKTGGRGHRPQGGLDPLRSRVGKGTYHFGPQRRRSAAYVEPRVRHATGEMVLVISAQVLHNTRPGLVEYGSTLLRRLGEVNDRIEEHGVQPGSIEVVQVGVGGRYGDLLVGSDACLREGVDSQVVVDLLGDLTHQGGLAEAGIRLRSLGPEETHVYVAANGAADEFPTELLGLLIEDGWGIG